MPLSLPVRKKQHLSLFPLKTYFYFLHRRKRIDADLVLSKQHIIFRNDNMFLFQFKGFRIHQLTEKFFLILCYIQFFFQVPPGLQIQHRKCSPGHCQETSKQHIREHTDQGHCQKASPYDHSCPDPFYLRLYKIIVFLFARRLYPHFLYRILSGNPIFFCTFRSVLLEKYWAFSAFSLIMPSI